MSSIGSIGSGTGGFSALQRPQPPSKEELLKRADADGSGGVDASELQELMSHRPDGAGSAANDSSVDFSALDSDSSGSLDATELDTAMKALMPKPGSTVEFVQQRGGSGGTESTSSTTYDPLDTNQDGVVSAQERAVGELKEAMQKLLEAADANGSDSVDATEATAMQDALSQALETVAGSSSSSSAGSDATSSGSKQDGVLQAQAAKLAQLVVQQYAAVSAQSGGQASTGSQLNLSA